MIYKLKNINTGDINKVVVLCKEKDGVRLYKGTKLDLVKLKIRSIMNPEVQYYKLKLNGNENIGELIKNMNSNLEILDKLNTIERI